MKMGKIDFDKDFHPEFGGYLWEQDGGVWISFIAAKEEGKGHFSKLLTELKAKYKWIKIPTPFAKMQMIALTHGFLPKQEYNKNAGETIDLMYWEKAEKVSE